MYKRQLAGRHDEFLLAESGRYKGRFGRIFHVRVRGWSAQMLAVLRLPPDEAGQPPANHEGLACARSGEDEWLLVLGERGGSAPRPRGSVRLGHYRLAAGSIQWQAATPVHVPGPWPAGRDLRDIADLALEADGSLWAVGAMDLGNAGPFRSTIWRLGTLDLRAAAPLRLEPQPRNAWVLDGLKVEALALPMRGMPGVRMVVGTDDEDQGGIWRTLSEPVPDAPPTRP